MTVVDPGLRHMAEALRLARRGLYTTDPNPRVGCVIARDGEIVGRGWHEVAGGPHAEIHALRQAGERARGATVYLTLEPCCHEGRTPPCTDALIAAGVARVVAAMDDPNPQVAGRGAEILRRGGIAVELGLMQHPAEELNPGFIRRMRDGRPYVRAKLAVSLDGRSAMASGESRWITGEAARADAQRWRARSSAILTGVGTVLADDPALTVRAFDIGRQPLRVVADSRLRTPAAARLLQQPGATLIAGADPGGARAEALRRAGAEVLCLPGPGGAVDLAALMTHLARREVNELLVEAGAGLTGALLGGGWVDELIVYLAPSLMGSHARGMADIPGLERLAERITVEITDVRAVGTDWRIVAKVVKNER